MTPLRLAWRSVRRGTAAWSAVVLVSMTTGASVYRAAYPTEAARQKFAASFGSSRGLDALYGRAENLHTVGGFLWWRYGATLAVVVALWGVLSTTRMLRGDEENGRTELLLAGPISPRSLMARQTAAIASSCAVIAIAAFVACTAARLSVASSVLYALAILLAGWAFAALAALVCQVTRTRRRAAGVTGAVLGIAYLVRAVADGAPHLHWVGWASPLGWVERISPFGARHSWLAVGLLLSLAVTALAGAVALRARRDAGDSAINAVEREGRLRSVRSLPALDTVLNRGSFFGWTAAACITGLLLGFIAADIASSVADNATLDHRTSNLTGASIASVRGFVGLSFAVVAVVAALYGGAQLISARSQESEGRLSTLLTSGATRRHWLLVRLAFAVGAVVSVTMLAGLAMWAGVRLSGQAFPFVDSLRGAVNTLPVSLLYMSLAMLAFGLAPRAVSAVAYGAVTASYALLIVTALGNAPRWLIDMSPLSHLAPVPASSANLGASFVMLALALVAGGVGALRFDRRDVEGE